MNNCSQADRFTQRGAATLLMALVLMMALTVITMSVAKTRVNAEQINANQQWQTRLFVAAESKQEEILSNIVSLTGWTQDPVSGQQHYQESGRGSDSQIETVLTLRRSPPPQRFIDMQVTARRDDGSTLAVQISQHVRQLTILSPIAETAPPLILGGCPASFPTELHIYPRNADSDQASDAIWLTKAASCPGLTNTDLHSGAITTRSTSYELRDMLFTLDRDAYAELANRERNLPASQRQYWLVQPSDLNSGRWSLSVGTVNQHVLLYFPEDAGCPTFADGVQIHGFVFPL